MIAACLVAITATSLGQVPTVGFDSTVTGMTFPGRVAAAGSVVYVTDQGEGAVLEVSGGVVAATYPIAEGPVGIAVHPVNGNIYVSRMDGQVGIYDAAFALQGTLNPAPLTMVAPNDIAVHPITGEVYVVDSGGHQVLVFEGTTGLLARGWGAEGSGLGEFRNPQAIAIDAALDHVLVADTDNFRVQVFDTSGIVQYKFGYKTLYAASTVAWFGRSEGIAVDLCSNVYVADALMGTVRVFSSLGQELDPSFVPVLAYGTDPGDLQVPIDVAIDGSAMYVVSSGASALNTYTVACSALKWNDSVLRTRETPSGKIQRRQSSPDNPVDIVRASKDGIYSRKLDLNRDRKVDSADLELAVAEFGAGSVDDILKLDIYPFALTAPHMLVDSPVICGRCHDMDGLPGGMLTDWGQENLCLSCHASSGIAMGDVVAGEFTAGVSGNDHPRGVLATSVDVMGPAADDAYELALHLDEGEIRCGTCHDPHEVGDGNFMRDPRPDAALCKQCHRGAGAPIDHAEGTTYGPERCDDCHDMHAMGDNPSLTKESMYSHYNGGMVAVGFSDNTTGVGDGGFVDPDAGEFGFCDVCHEYYDDSVNPPVVSAEFLGLGLTHDENMAACTDCHKHENGFHPGLALGMASGEWVGKDTCAVCHPGEHAQWDATLHKSARANLPPIPDLSGCLPCHTVGFGDPTGYVDEATTPELAGVQCENCHGSGADHVNLANAENITVDHDSEMCGTCHTDAHHPTIDEFETSGHAEAYGNSHRSSCDECHAPLREAVGDSHAEIGVECVACHDSHAQTGNDGVPDPEGVRDSQLLYPELASPTPSNSIADATDPTRFNLCGQCHHSRGKVWTEVGRGPHHSQQANVFLGEMPMPVGEEMAPLVQPVTSDHAVVAGQCNTCHMHKTDFVEGPPDVDADTGHSWHVNFEACVGCHDSAAGAEAMTHGIQAAVIARLEGIQAALGDPAVWEYTSGGGPLEADDCAADPECTYSQDDVPDDVKKARFIVKYIEGDASFGVHNGPYTAAMLEAAETLAGVASLEAVYMGADTCSGCHGTMHADWSGTLHSVARDNLPALPDVVLAGCLPCHTVAFGEPYGFVDDATTPELAGVQCENCHGDGGQHVLNPTNAATQPIASKAAEMCGACHTDAHHPTYDEWSISGHAATHANAHGIPSCFGCHAPLGEEGDPAVTLDVECIACHDSHMQTGNNAIPNPPHDAQLLHPEVVVTVPSNSIADATDPTRFNLCGQCHHSRGRTWDSSTSRGPHHSLQGNFLVGEMPMSIGQELTPLVPNQATTHSTTPQQCGTCHMATAPHEDGPPEVEAITGHEFHMTTGNCSALGCHASVASAEAALVARQANTVAAIDAIAAADGSGRLGDPLLWEYSSGDGPPSGSPGQDEIPDEVRKVRFMIKYIEGDASMGAHNPIYTQDILDEANALLDGYVGTWPPAGGAWWGACCDAVPACIGTMTEGDCTAAAGTWHAGEDCADEEFVCP